MGKPKGAPGTLHFDDWQGKTIVAPTAEHVRPLILHPPEPRLAGGVRLYFVRGERCGPEMLVQTRPEADDMYVKLETASEVEWLSLGDPKRLDEVCETDDAWDASVGLFVSRERAWKAVEEFMKSGERSPALEWIRPKDLPEGGNW